MDIFEQTIRPEESLFNIEKDPNDQKMAEIVANDPSSYQNSKLVILGYPEDEGVKRNDGREGARMAPKEIRNAFYKLTTNENIASLKIFDLGDTVTDGSLEEVHERHHAIVYQILKDGKQLITLGGGNDISYPDCKALSNFHENLTAFNIDSHFDVRDIEPRNSGTPYRQLLQENCFEPSNFYEMGNKPLLNSQNYHDYLKDIGAHVFSIYDLRENGIENIFPKILKSASSDTIFWGFDMDSVRNADAPGVSAGYPIGLTAEEICKIADLAGRDVRSKLFEISEVNPVYDVDGRTSKLAALVLLYYLNAKSTI